MEKIHITENVSKALISIIMENMHVNEIVSSIDDRTDQDTVQDRTNQDTVHDTELRSDDHDTVKENRPNEPYQTFGIDQSKQDIARASNKFISRSRAVCAFRVIVSVAVTATIIAVIILFTTKMDIDDCATMPCLNGYCNDQAYGYSCSCFAGFSGIRCGTVITDCVDIRRYTESRTDGIYTVRTWKSHQVIEVYCDMTTDGGGWMVFQNRFDGSVDFYRNFSEYDTGFGTLTTEFWLGLSNIQEIAVQGQNDLRIDLEDADGTKAYETFSNFYLSSGPAYTLHLGATIASLRISSYFKFGSYHSGSDFSTYDDDADNSAYNCAEKHHCGWWYNDNNCYRADLNGRYLTPGTSSSGMNYNSFVYGKSLKSSKMMMRRK